MQGRSAERRELPSDDAAVKHREELLDEALEGTFPASDPFSLNVVATSFSRTNSVDEEWRDSITASALLGEQTAEGEP